MIDYDQFIKLKIFWIFPYMEEANENIGKQITNLPVKDAYESWSGTQNNSQGQRVQPAGKRRRNWKEDDKMSKVVVKYGHEYKFRQFDPKSNSKLLYMPGVQLPDLSKCQNQQIRIIAASEYLTILNPKLIERNIYGSNIYTSDSDAVCMAVHSGLLNLKKFNQKKIKGVQLTLKVIGKRKNFDSAFKNGVLSRSFKGYPGYALKPIACENLASLEDIEILEQYASNMQVTFGNRFRPIPRRLNNSQMIYPQTHFVFNMNNDLAHKYSLMNLQAACAQYAYSVQQKLETHDLYLQTKDLKKYQLIKNPKNKTYKLSRMCDHLIHESQCKQKQCSFQNPAILQVIKQEAEWLQIEWGNQQISTEDRLIPKIFNFKFQPKTSTL